MQYKWDKKYLYWGVTAFLVVAASVLFFGLVTNFSAVFGGIMAFLDILMPIFYGMVIAYLLTPIANFFEKKCFYPLFIKVSASRQEKKIAKNPLHPRKDKTYKYKKISRGLGVLATVIVVLAALGGFLLAVIPALFETLFNLPNTLKENMGTVENWAQNNLKNYPGLAETLTNSFNSITTYVQNWINNDLIPSMKDMWVLISSGVMSVVMAFFNIMMGFVVSIYILYSRELFAAQSKKLLYGVLSKKNANLILRNIRNVHHTFGGFITGKIIDSLVVGALFFIAFVIFDVPYALLNSVIMAVTNIIPYFGPFIGVFLSAPLILLDDPIKVIYLIIISLIIQQIDGNFLAPKITGETTGLSSFWAIFSILLFQGLFGFMGLIIGVPIFAVLYTIIKNRVVLKLREKGLPEDSNAYRSIAYIESETGEPIPLPTAEAERKKAENKDKSILKIFKRKKK